MPVFNAAPFLEQALGSVLKQTFSDFEFIIVNDGSTDGSEEIIRAFASQDHRIKYLKMENHGPARAMNVAMETASGRYFVRVDADDFACPERFQRQFDVMENAKVDIVGCQVEPFGQVSPPFWFPESEESIRRELLFRCPILGATMMVRTAALKGRYYNESALFDDYEFLAYHVPHTRAVNLHENLVKYRIHDSQSSKVKKERNSDERRKYGFRYFCTMYPASSIEEFLPIDRVASHLPMKTLADLERAGVWLSLFSQSDDSMLRKVMGKRWRRTCTLSKELVPQTKLIFPKYGKLIDPDDLENEI